VADVVDRLNAALEGRYRIERELGAGGMATVYLAADLKHDRKVAVKVLKPELTAVLGADRFIQEIKTTASLQHPHILPLFDSGTADGFLFYVMPYIEGETLREKLDRETQFGIDEAVRISREVADALDYAHRNGIIHRDIKPENILLHDGRPMVADFGIALAVSAAAGGRMTETGTSVGTPHYMSPEQATADKEITGRADQYSLASVLYEMLTGSPPHVGSSAQQVIMKIIAEPVQPVTSVRKNVPPNVAAAAMKALEKLPADRFESARAFADALANPAFTTALAAHGTTQPLSDVRAIGAWIRSPWSWAALAVAASAVIISALTARRGGDAPAPLFIPRTFESEAIFNARFTEDGETILYSATHGSGWTPRIFVIRADHPDPVPLGPDSTHLLSISAAGELAILTHATYIDLRLFSGTLSTLPLGGGSPRELATGVREADWAPDGMSMAIIRDTARADQLEYPVGTVIARSSGYLSDPRVSPEGDAVAYVEHATRWDDRGAIVIVDRTGSVIARSDLVFWAIEGVAWQPDGRGILFSAKEGARTGGLVVHEMDRSGHLRAALSSAGHLTVLDVSPSGRLLVTQDRYPSLIFGRGPGQTEASIMGVRDYSFNPRLSGDGRYLAFEDESALSGVNYAALVRKTDGSPEIRLGEGGPVAITHDGGLVLVVVHTIPAQLVLHPTGPGQSHRLDAGQFDGLDYESGAIEVLGADTVVFFCGAERGRRQRCYLHRAGGSPAPVTPEGTMRAALSPDGRRVFAIVDDTARVYPVGGGEPRPALGLTPEDVVVRWSPDGRELWVWANDTSTSIIRVDRVDPETGMRAELLSLALHDVAGVRSLEMLTLADDPNVFAYGQWRYTSTLYTVEGMR